MIAITVLLQLLLLVMCVPSYTRAEPAVLEKITVASNVNGIIHDIQVGNLGGSANSVITGGANGVLLMKKLTGNSNQYAAPQTIISSLSNGASIDKLAVGDLNDDGRDDFVHVVNSQAVTGTPAASSPGALQSAVARSDNTFQIQSLLSNTRLTLPGTGTVLARVNGRDVKLADMNGDDSLDIIATVNGQGDQARTGALVYLRNTGPNTYETTYIDESLGGIALLSIADFDVDGRPDIATVRLDTKELVVYFNEADGNFTTSVIDASAESNMCIGTGDFNNIGRPDILLMGMNSIHLYINVNNRRFSKNKMFEFNSTGFKSTDYRDMQCEFWDMDGNSLLDMTIVRGHENGVQYYAQASANLFAFPPRMFAPANSTSNFVMQDMNGNGFEDVISVSVADKAVYAFMVGEKQPTPPTLQPVPVPQRQPTRAPVQQPRPPPTRAPVPAPPTGGEQCAARGAQCTTSKPCCSTDDVCRGVCARKTINTKTGDKSDIKLDYDSTGNRGMRTGTRQRILKGSG